MEENKKKHSEARHENATKPTNKVIEEEFEGVELCDKCGSEKILEDGEMICPDCDTEIDFFGEEDE